mmetsp:Transcript_23586/g.72561  ORF Transcript_23586/g.72561 Transcript_23586/m.72561 type:complete len:97 (-) Transcript_23586:463-753(-)
MTTNPAWDDNQNANLGKGTSRGASPALRSCRAVVLMAMLSRRAMEKDNTAEKQQQKKQGATEPWPQSGRRAHGWVAGNKTLDSRQQQTRERGHNAD